MTIAILPVRILKGFKRFRCYDVTRACLTMLTSFKKALATRRLFDNWLSLMFRYALIKAGLNVKLEVKIGDCRIEINPGDFASLVSGYYLGLISSIECVDGRIFVNYVGWKYDESCNCWLMNNIKFRRMRYEILNVFGEGLYSILDVDGKVVIDVGAFVGDSAIYFASRGAKKVIAIEPHPGAFREMLDNIKLNNLENVVVPLNVGLASKHGKICIEKVDIERTVGTYHRPGECDVMVPAITLADVVNKHGVNHDAILKMDCEGCEFDVILNDYEHVRIFKELLIEYHLYASSEPLFKLLKVLTKDYLCRFVKRAGKRIGIIYCIRNW